MSTLAPLSTAQVCVDTPMVNVRDNRGLTVRTLQYNRHAPTDTVQQLISQQRYGVRGELLSSIDPRLFAEQQVSPGVLANFRYHTSLSGQLLRTKSQDAGDKVVLYDIENGPVWQEDSRARIKRLAYDVLHRLITVFEQESPSAPERISERNVYGESESDATLANCRGQLVHNYHTAGLNAVPHYNCTGQPLLQERVLLSDPLALSDWQGGESDWDTALDSEQFPTWLSYNALDELVMSEDAKGNLQQQRFNIAGQLARSSLTLSGGLEQLTLSAIRYSAAGQVLQETAGNGVVTDYTYEPQTQRLNRLLTLRPADGGRARLLQDLTYSYDPVGNILSIGNAAIAVSYHRNQRIEPANDYQYDALYQLISASGRENASAGQQGQGLPVPQVPISADPNQYSQYTRLYTYDRGGNLTQIRHQGSTSYTLDTVVSPSSNHAVQQSGHILPSDVEAFFDACGNLTQLAPGQPLHWDGRNQLQRVTQVERPGGNDDAEHYQYDGGGQRVRKTTRSQTSGTLRSAEVIYLPGLELRRTRSSSGGTTTTVEDLQVISAGSAGRQQVRVLHWDTGRPADLPNGQWRASLDNQIGSSVLELDQDAHLLTQEEYFPFGGTAVWSGKSSSETKYKFIRYSGKELDATGLYYYGYRYYAPWLGRWINPDPAGTTDGVNLFEMVGNNPISFGDIDGRIKYAFTHEIDINALNFVSKTLTLIAGAVHGKGLAPQSDVTRSGGLHPVFTRVLSIQKTGDKKALKRSALSSTVGGDRPVVILLHPDTATASHDAVEQQIKGTSGWPAVPYTPKNMGLSAGLQASYNMDVGKAGPMEQNRMSPEDISTSPKYIYNNEQHWHKGISLAGNVMSVAIKVTPGASGELELGTNKQDEKKLYSKADLIRAGGAVKTAAEAAAKLGGEVYGVTASYYLEDLIDEYNKTAAHVEDLVGELGLEGVSASAATRGRIAGADRSQSTRARGKSTVRAKPVVRRA